MDGGLGNAGWPEAFGFRIGGGAPVFITHVQPGTLATEIGLLPGDQIVDVDAVNVQSLSCDQIRQVAARSRKVPPSLSVISRVRTMQIPRPVLSGGREPSVADFGLTVRGDGPIFVRSVDVNGAARRAGIRSGDMILEIEGTNVQSVSRDEAMELLASAEDALHLVLIASGLEPLPRQVNASLRTPSDRYSKAKIFYEQMDFYLLGEDARKGVLSALLKQYARDKSVERFASALAALLVTDTQRRLLKYIRDFIPSRSYPQFDVMVSMDSTIMAGNDPRLQRMSPSESQGSLRPPTNLRRDLSSSVPTLTNTNALFDRNICPASTVDSDTWRVQLKKGHGSVGFTVRGGGKPDQPIIVVAVDKGGPAHSVGVRVGDHLLEVNGLNVRRLPYQAVMELLAGSGAQPTLVFARLRSPMASVVRRDKAEILMEGERRSRTSSLVSDSDIREQSREFRRKMDQLLTKEEQRRIMAFLAQYNKNRNLPSLVDCLIAELRVLPKLRLLHNISQMLPENEQTKFDRLAASALAKLRGRFSAVRGAYGSESGENLEDTLFRVQAGAIIEQNTSGYIQRWTPGQEFGSGDDSYTVRGHQVASYGGSGESGHLVRLPAGMKVVPADAMVTYGEPNDSHRNRRAPRAKPRTRASGEVPSVQVGDFGSYDSSGGTDEDEAYIENGAARPGSRGKNLKPVPRSPTGAATLEEEAQINEAEAVGAQTAKVKLRERSEKITAAQRLKIADKRTSLVGSNLDALLSGKKPNTSDPQPPPEPGSIPPPPPPPPLVLGPDGIPLPPPPPPLALGPDGIPLPPPLGPDGIPLPPPLFGFGAQQANLKKLKRANWEKLSSVHLQGTVWSEVAEEEALMDALEIMELEEKFAAADGPGLKENQKKKERTLIDSKKVLNISVLLEHLRMPIEEIKLALLAMDTSRLSEQHLRTMKDFAPDDKELATLKAYKGKLERFSKADQFSYELSTIPKYSERISGLLFQMHFQSKVDEIKPDLVAIINASRQLKASKGFRAVLKIILQVGNKLNEGNSRIGAAFGFKIIFLNKLEGTKTSDNKSNLLQYVIQKAQVVPAAAGFADELNAMADAARVSNQTLSEEVNDIKTNLKQIKSDLLDVSQAEETIDGDRFQEVMEEFIEESAAALEELLLLYDQMQSEYTEIVTFFGEDPKKMRSDEFFTIFNDFVQNYRRAERELHKAIEAEKERQRREQEREERRKLSSRKTSGVITAHNSSASLEDVAQLRQRLRPAQVAVQERGEVHHQEALGPQLLKPAKVAVQERVEVHRQEALGPQLLKPTRRPVAISRSEHAPEPAIVPPPMAFLGDDDESSWS